MAKRDNKGTRSSQSSETTWIIAAIALSVVCTLLAGITIRGIVNGPASRSSQAAAELQPTANSGSPTLVMKVEDFGFRISGFVPSEAVRRELDAATKLAYGDLGVVDLVVDPQKPGVSDIAELGPLPQNLTRLVEGSFELYDNSIILRGTSPDITTRLNLLRLVGTLGFVNIDERLEVSELGTPTVEFNLAGNQLTASGEVTDEQTATVIGDRLRATFGSANVDDSQLTTNPSVSTPFDVITTAANLGAYAAFGDFELAIRDSQTFVDWEQGVGFAFGESELSPDQEEKLAQLPPLIANRPDLQALITGHTDDAGTDQQNKVLSQARAQSIVDFFVQNGVDPGQAIAIGRGSSDPIASNETSDGRAANRRVTISFV